MAACVREPGNSDTVAEAVALHATSQGHDLAHDLVARNDVRLGMIELAVDDVKIRPADAAGVNLDEDLVLLWSGTGTERRTRGAPGFSSTMAIIVSGMDICASTRVSWAI